LKVRGQWRTWGEKAAGAGLTCIPKFFMEAETLAVE